MDRKDWRRIIEHGIDRYRLHVAGEPAYEGDDGAWSAQTLAEASVEDHVVEALQCVADVGGEQLG